MAQVERPSRPSLWTESSSLNRSTVTLSPFEVGRFGSKVAVPLLFFLVIR